MTLKEMNIVPLLGGVRLKAPRDHLRQAFSQNSKNIRKAWGKVSGKTQVIKGELLPFTRLLDFTNGCGEELQVCAPGFLKLAPRDRRGEGP